MSIEMDWFFLQRDKIHIYVIIFIKECYLNTIKVKIK